MLRFYVSDNPENLDEYADPLKHAYKLNVHRFTDTRTFILSLSRTPPKFKVHYDDDFPLPKAKDWIAFVEQL